MALKPCRECKKKVSTQAATCPNCGAPKPTLSEIPSNDDVLSKSNEKHHPIAIPTGSSSNFIDGFVYKISNKELK